MTETKRCTMCGHNESENPIGIETEVPRDDGQCPHLGHNESENPIGIETMREGTGRPFIHRRHNESENPIGIETTLRDDIVFREDHVTTNQKTR